MEDKATGQQWALKAVFINKPGLPTAHQQILSCEANFLMQLAHPHVVQGREIVTGRADEPWCVVMEVLRGRSIFADLAMVEYGETAAARLFSQLVSAVAYLHANNVLHRCVLPLTTQRFDQNQATVDP